MLIIYHVVFLHTDPEDVVWNIEAKDPNDPTMVLVWHSLGEEKFWLNWNDIGSGDTVVPGGEEQVWKKTDQPSSGGYFTLENTDSGKVLTAVNGSFQVKGT